MSQACIALNYPIISGNASLYNETNGKGILPTPAIGGVGILKDLSKCIGNSFTAEGEDIILIGETKGHLGQSLFLREILGKEEGAPPPVDLAVEKKNGDFVRELIQGGKVSACHDISDGGLLVAIAEMTYRRGVGATLSPIPNPKSPIPYFFGEDQARYIITTKNAAAILEAAKKSGITAEIIGITQAEMLEFAGEKIATAELKKANESWLPNFMM